MTYAYRRLRGTLNRRLADKPRRGELVSHTGKRPRTSHRRQVALDANNRPIRTFLILVKGKKAS